MSRRSWPPARALLAAVAATLASTVGPPPAAAAAAGDDVTVTIGDAVDPALVDVAVGTTVTWHNADDRRHRVRSTSGPVRFDSGNLEPGEGFAFTFGLAGTYAYADHRDEDDGAYHGTVVVAGSPAPQAAPATTASEPAATPAPSSPPAASPAPSQVEVRIPDRSFAPADVVVAVGGTVTWHNDSGDEHTVTSADDGGGGGFDSGLLAGGATFAQRFDDPGTHRYVCLLHDEMTGTVEVAGLASEGPTGGDPGELAAAVGAGPRTLAPPAIVGAVGIATLLALLGLVLRRRRRRSARTEPET